MDAVLTNLQPWVFAQYAHLAMQDKNPSREAAEQFNKLATAYQVLGSNESRTSYDYALAHPREHMLAYYRRYSSRVYAQMKIPPQYSITGLVLIISIIQYMSRKMSHEKVIFLIELPQRGHAPAFVWEHVSVLRELLQCQSLKCPHASLPQHPPRTCCAHVDAASPAADAVHLATSEHRQLHEGCQSGGVPDSARIA